MDPNKVRRVFPSLPQQLNQLSGGVAKEKVRRRKKNHLQSYLQDPTVKNNIRKL
jgi:hypothetical protein